METPRKAKRPPDGTLLHLGSRPLETGHATFTAHLFRNSATRAHAVVLALGELRAPAPLLARVHSSCVTSEAFGAIDCDCSEQLDLALAEIATSGRGVLFYLMQEGRGAGFAAKALDRMLVQASGHALTTYEAYEQMGLGRDQRRYDEVAFARRLLAIDAPLRLLTNNPDKVRALAAAGVPIAETVPLRHEPSPYDAHYIAAKSRSGHALLEPNAAGGLAELPGEVSAFEPYALADRPTVIHVASYWLPVRTAGGNGPAWFRAHAYVDLDEGTERVALVHGEVARKRPLLRFQNEPLFDRFPSRTIGAEKRSWRASVERFVEHESGLAVFLPEGRPAAKDETALTLALLLSGGAARPLLASRTEESRPLLERLETRGLEVLDPVIL